MCVVRSEVCVWGRGMFLNTLCTATLENFGNLQTFFHNFM